MDKYERVRVVGRGAFGTVYLCRRLADDREVIIKQIPVEQLNKLDRKATINEVKVLAMLHHPNIIEYYENFIQDKAMMIVMEYAAGGTLFDLIEEKAKESTYLPEDEIAHLFAQIVLPLQLVHSRQVLHRDLKTQNIFLTKGRDHIKIGDFGISKILSSKSKAYTVVGTPCYISPELCEGKPYNQKSDIWALGCVLYEMCTLKRAFEAPTLPALVLKIMRGTCQPLPSHFSSSLKEFVALLLAVDPNNRPTLSEMMSHHWLAPHVYRLPTSLGALPCTAKPPRPLSVTRLEEFNVSPLMQRRTVSPFQQDSRTSVVLQLKAGGRSVRRLDAPTGSQQLTLVCSVSAERTLGVTSEGRVVEWKGGSTRPKMLEGLSGITITYAVASTANNSSSSFFCCMLTDRGILLTYGSGAEGCLGHGDRNDIKRPKIVEALLGDEVVKIDCSGSHVAALTSDNDLFVWGSGASKAAGLDDDRRDWTVPHKIELPSDLRITDVTCGERATVLTTSDGRVVVAGRNEANRFGLRGKENNGLGFRISQDIKKAKEVKLVGAQSMFILGENGECRLYGRNTTRIVETPRGETANKISCSGGNVIVLSTNKGSIFYLSVDRESELKRVEVEAMSNLDLALSSLCCHSVDNQETIVILYV